MKFIVLLMALALTLPAALAFDTDVTDQGEFIRFYSESNPDVSSHGVFVIRKSVIACVLCEKTTTKDGFYQVWITSERETNGGISLKYKFKTYEEAVKFADRVTLVLNKDD